MSVRILIGDARDQLRQIADASVHCVVTSPPYFGLRDYGVDGQIGLEDAPEAYITEMVAVFREVRRAMRKDATLWLNIGDSYAGGDVPGWRRENEAKNGGNSNKNGVGYVPGWKPKDLIGIPWMLAFALRADGWYLRQDIIWSKPNPMPESVNDRCTKAHEYLFLLSKSARYYFDQEAILEPSADASLKRLSQNVAAQRGSGRVPGKTNGPMRAVIRNGPVAQHKQTELGRDLSGSTLGSNEDFGARNKRSVWEVTTQPFSEAHFATFPPALIEPCILAGCPVGGTVLDPFFGAGTTGLVADRLGRDCIGIELNPAYAAMAKRRIEDDAPLFAEIELWGDRGETLPEAAIINGLGGDETYLLKLSMPPLDTGGNPRKRRKLLDRSMT
jgi:DNA modification methylase